MKAIIDFLCKERRGLDNISATCSWAIMFFGIGFATACKIILP